MKINSELSANSDNMICKGGRKSGHRSLPRITFIESIIRKMKMRRQAHNYHGIIRTEAQSEQIIGDSYDPTHTNYTNGQLRESDDKIKFGPS